SHPAYIRIHNCGGPKTTYGVYGARLNLIVAASQNRTFPQAAGPLLRRIAKLEAGQREHPSLSSRGHARGIPPPAHGIAGLYLCGHCGTLLVIADTGSAARSSRSMPRMRSLQRGRYLITRGRVTCVAE